MNLIIVLVFAVPFWIFVGALFIDVLVELLRVCPSRKKERAGDSGVAAQPESRPLRYDQLTRWQKIGLGGSCHYR